MVKIKKRYFAKERKNTLLTRFNLGIGFDRDDDPYEIIVNEKTLIPENHDYLFSFLKKGQEMKHIKAQLEAYPASGPDRSKAKAVLKEIRNLHPYFAYGQNAAGLFNMSLAGILWTQNRHGIEEMEENFRTHAVKAVKGQSDDIHDFLLSDRHTQTIESLMEARDDLENRVALILDDSNPDMASLPPEVRNSLYAFTTGRNETPLDILKMPVRYSIPVSSGMRGFGAAMDFDDRLAEQYSDGVRKLKGMREGLPDVIRSAVSYSDGEKETSVVTYEINTLESLLDFEAFQMVSHGIRVNRCADCGELFPVVEAGQKCCTFTRTDGKTCRERETARRERNDLKKSVLYFRNRAYKTHYARVKAGRETGEDMAKWKEYAKSMREKVLDGRISLEEFASRITDPQ